METADLKEIAKSLLSAGRRAEAMRIFEKVRQRAPEDVYVLDVLGFLHYMAGDFQTARSRCEQSLAVAPENHYAAKGLGLCLVRLGQVDEGLASLQRSIELEPGYFDSRHDLGVTLMELGRFQEAREAFEGARRAAPDRGEDVDRALEALSARERAASG